MCIGRLPKNRRRVVQLQLSADNEAEADSALDVTQNKNLADGFGSGRILSDWASTTPPTHDAPAVAKKKQPDADTDRESLSSTVRLWDTDSFCSDFDSDEEEHDQKKQPVVLKSCLKKAVPAAAVPEGKIKKKSVQFDQVHVRTYNQMMGDYTNSWCGSGPPVILTDLYQVHPPTSVDAYESNKLLASSAVDGIYIPLDAMERRRLLIENWGYSLREVMARERDIIALRQKEIKAQSNCFSIKNIKRRLALSARAG